MKENKTLNTEGTMKKLYKVTYRTRGETSTHWKSPMSIEVARRIACELANEGWHDILVTPIA